MGKVNFTPENFAEPKFWKEFYATGGHLDWYGDIKDYKAILKPLMKPEHSILQVGCGNASSEYSLYDMGYEKIHNIDIDKGVIDEKKKAQNAALRPGLTYACEDATKLSADDNTYDIVFDKGTLDALLPPEHDEAHLRTVFNMFTQALRVLKPNGKYLIISLAQEHILRVVEAYYQTRHDVFLSFYALEVPDASTGNMYTAAIIKFQKLPKAMPEGFAKVIKFITQLVPPATVNVTIDEVVDVYTQQRKLAFFTNECRGDLQHIASITLQDPKSSKPRWRFIVCDKKKNAKSWAFLCFPPDHCFEFDEVNVRKIVAQTSFDRVILAEQQLDVHYGDLTDVSKELEHLSFRFKPKNGDAIAEIAWCYNEKTDEIIVDKGQSEILGGFGVYNWVTESKGVKQTYRRLVFDNSPDIVQSDVIVSAVDETDTICSNVDVLNLNNAYQCMMISALDFRSGNLIDAVKKNYKIAVLGVGGGNLVTFLHFALPLAKITAVELVPELYDIARRWFAYPTDGDRLTSLTQDALQWIENNDSGTFDFIFVDVSDVVDTVTTCPGLPFVDPDFIPKYKKRLNKNGYIIMNIVSIDRDFSAKVLNDFHKVFKHVLCGMSGDPTNLVMVASDTPFGRPRDYNIMRMENLPQQLRAVYGKANLYEPHILEDESKENPDTSFLPRNITNPSPTGQKKKNKKNKA